MGALQFVHVPGYAGAIFRRTKVEMAMADSPGARLEQWLSAALAANVCEWDGASSSYVFPTSDPSAPATVHLGYLKNEADRLRYIGSAFQFIGIDELTGWAEDNYAWLFSRLRYSKRVLEWLRESPGERLPLRMRSTTNPGGPGHEWVRARFIEQAKHVVTGTDARDDMRRRREKGTILPAPPVYVSPPSVESIEVAKLTGRPAQGAHFMPAFVEDNPAMRGDSLAAYLANLARLTPTQYARMRWGDWDAAGEGGFFTEGCFDIVDHEPAGVHIQWIRSWDFAATVPEPGTDPDWSAGVRIGVFKERDTNRGRVIVSHVKRFRLGPGATDKAVVMTARIDGKRVPILVEQEPGSAGKRQTAHFKSTLLFGWNVKGIRKTGPKREYWESLSSVVSEECPMLLVRTEGDDWIKPFVDELTNIPDGHDDQADAAAQGYAELTEKLEGAQRARAQVGMS